MDGFKLCSDGEFLPVSLPCPPPYSGPYYYYPYDNIPLSPQEGSSDYAAASSSKGGPPISSGAVAGIIIIVGFFFFIMCLIALKFRTRFILGSILRVSSRNARSNEHTGELLVNSGDMLVNVVGCGLEEKLVNLLPVCEYVGLMEEGKIDGKERHECAVCLSLFEEKEIVRVLPKCHHIFHLQCIDRWFESHANCPLCRERITLQTIQFSFNSEKDDDQQPFDPALLHQDLTLDIHSIHGDLSHHHLNDQPVNSPPSRDVCVHHINHQQDGRLTCDLQDPNPHQNIFLAVTSTSARNIDNPHTADADEHQNADEHVTHVAGGKFVADHRKEVGFPCRFQGICDQKALGIPAVTAEFLDYKQDAESRVDEDACNEAARDARERQLSAGLVCGLQRLYDDSNASAGNDRSDGPADDWAAGSHREFNETGGFINPKSSQEAHASHMDHDEKTTLTSPQAEKSVLCMQIASPHASSRQISLLRRSLSAGCINESASHPAFHGNITREML